ncbi:uncharacterized protein LOC121415911 isoform X1 [Lytechinus variegatus]|uniref:uncharacterized protein LOC121415911 isoform X1 n=1 Tax=Lytechinus variegatus TaxID=7654 RepID=UPI001BB0E748|nr:uncharacterized protein LOC121415911 isoform X1 [Lytechinus variegatus]XP_041465242.1 uncharacterized protein LOC121415911 isoform X1 [Lytechinus variegatus]XP_041465250.1 uncharacterized protein LOC121415911 isoform X1 [Lytechinus variegatus]XP_041465257.1 uncharacterized protein LOC121415911 isoform X1 [Lytechinus variegatus]
MPPKKKKAARDPDTAEAVLEDDEQEIRTEKKKIKGKGKKKKKKAPLDTTAPVDEEALGLVNATLEEEPQPEDAGTAVEENKEDAARTRSPELEEDQAIKEAEETEDAELQRDKHQHFSSAADQGDGLGGDEPHDDHDPSPNGEDTVVPSQEIPQADTEPQMEGITDDADGDREEMKKLDDAAEEMIVRLDTEEKTRSRVNPEEYDNADPKDFGIEVESDDEYKYLPPSNDDLPNLENLIGTLEEGDSELHTEREPPTLFNRPEHEPSYRQISHLRQELEEEKIDPYIDRFEDNVRDDVLMIGNISLEEVQEEERRLRDEHIAYQQQEAQLARTRQEDILLKEERSKKHVTDVMKKKRKELALREELSIQRERLLQDQLHKTFKKAENLLKRSLEIRKGEVKTMYGDLMMADGQYGGSKGRRWKVDWNRAPQPIQIKLKCLRGVKDKLPAGRFILMTSLYDRLGGHVLRWSNLRGQEWSGSTLPLNHDGHFYNVEITIDQSQFTVCPSKPDIRPGMVLVFELFLLRGTLLPVDKVVAWGVFPICDGQFEVLQGKYKTPMLRGEIDTRIDRHETVEKLMASDLDHWLCNLYFEIVRLPRYLAGQKEYEVELQFSSNLIGYPDRIKGAEEAIDGEEPVPGSQVDMVSSNGDNQSAADVKGSKVSFGLGSEEGEGSTPRGGSSSIGTGSIKAGLTSSEGSVKDNDSMKLESEASTKTIESSEGVRFRGTKPKDEDPPPTTVGSRKLLGKYEKAYLDTDSESDEDDEDYIKKKEDGFRPVKGEPGLFYKQHLNPPQTDYIRRMYTMIPKTTLLNQRKKRKKLTHLEELATHGFAVQKPFSTKGHTARRGHEKVQYISRQLFAELGLSQWRSREFWTLILLLCVIFFIRMYLHYLGQWAFLNIITVPISKFQFLPYTVTLNYQSSLLQTSEEVAVVILGPLTNIVILSLLVFICWLFQKVVGNFPDLFCKFVIVFSIMTLLDPFLIAIIDAPLGRYSNTDSDVPIADAAKLYYHFYRIHDNGLMGILLTVPIILFLSFLTCVIFYMYFLRLHNNGRMLDIFHRLHAAEDDFFMPFDLEISNQELAYICNKAEQWRGEEGERRKVAVYDYIWEEEDEEDNYDESPQKTKEEEGKREITTHVSVHTLHLDGLRELFRHFLRLPDGSIVEVFGEMGVVGLDKDLRAALQNQTSGLEKWAGSAESIHLLSLDRAGIDRTRPKTQGGIGSQDLLNIPGTPSPALRRKGEAFGAGSLGEGSKMTSQPSLQVPHNLGGASPTNSEVEEM